MSLRIPCFLSLKDKSARKILNCYLIVSVFHFSNLVYTNTWDRFDSSYYVLSFGSSKTPCFAAAAVHSSLEPCISPHYSRLKHSYNFWHFSPLNTEYILLLLLSSAACFWFSIWEVQEMKYNSDSLFLYNSKIHGNLTNKTAEFNRYWQNGSCRWVHI